MIVFKGRVEQISVESEMRKLHNQMETLKRCGLDKEAKKLLPKYNELVYQRDEFDAVIHNQRRASVLKLLVCFVAADLATLAADEFEDICGKVCKGLKKADDAFVQVIKEQARQSADGWNKVVQIFDEGANNERLEMFYAEFSESITDKVLPIINEEVKTIMENTKKGQNWL